ncbi:MAG: hypothetical protein ACRD3V_00735 [Vicinamibacteria bacterium]
MGFAVVDVRTWKLRLIVSPVRKSEVVSHALEIFGLFLRGGVSSLPSLKRPMGNCNGGEGTEPDKNREAQPDKYRRRSSGRRLGKVEGCASGSLAGSSSFVQSVFHQNRKTRPLTRSNALSELEQNPKGSPKSDHSSFRSV